MIKVLQSLTHLSLKATGLSSVRTLFLSHLSCLFCVFWLIPSLYSFIYFTETFNEDLFRKTKLLIFLYLLFVCVRQVSREQQELQGALQNQLLLNQKLSQDKDQLLFKLQHCTPSIHLGAMLPELAPRWAGSHASPDSARLWITGSHNPPRPTHTLVRA